VWTSNSTTSRSAQLSASLSQMIDPGQDHIEAALEGAFEPQ